MTEYKMLGEFVCYCNKCKLDLNHRIVLMDGDEPARVLCLTCQAEHKYRKTSPAKKGVVAKKSLSAADKSKARRGLEEEEWRKKLEDKDVTPVTYNIQESYTLDDHVYHPKFGLGLIVGFDHPEKIHVFFDQGVKILKGKKAA